MRNAGLDEAQAGVKIAGRNSNNLRYVDDTTLMPKSEEELKSLLMKVKEDSEQVDYEGSGPAVAAPPAQRQNLKIASASQTEHAEGKPRPHPRAAQGFLGLGVQPPPPGLLDGLGAGRALWAQMGRREGAKLQTEVRPAQPEVGDEHRE